MGRPKGRSTVVRSITLDGEVNRYLSTVSNASGLINSLVKIHMSIPRTEVEDELRDRITKKVQEQQEIEKKYEETTELLGMHSEKKLVNLLPDECKKIYKHIVTEKRGVLYTLKKTGAIPTSEFVKLVVSEAEWILNVELEGDRAIRKILKKAVENFDIIEYEKEERKKGRLACELR